MAIEKIKFGTSGWRGVIADDFTVSRVRAVTQAIADHLIAQGLKDKGVVVGYDTRFLSERFAAEAVRVLAANGIRSYLSNRDVPTPAVAFEIIRRKAAGGINFTASHNPPEYNGLKFSPAWGGPALPETTKDIETRANALVDRNSIPAMPLAEAKQKGMVEDADLRRFYLDDLRKKIDFEPIRKAKLKIGARSALRHRQGLSGHAAAGRGMRRHGRARSPGPAVRRADRRSRPRRTSPNCPS